MAKVTIAHRPQLTKEEAQAVFARHFAGKYRVEPYTKPLRDFAVIKSSFVGVSVKLEQKADRTNFIFTAYSPSWWAAMLVGGVFSSVMGRGLMAEVRQFIETAPEFNEQVPAAAG